MGRERSIGKVCKNGNSLMVSIPRPMLHRLGWHLGTRVLLELREGGLVVAELDRVLENRALERMSTALPPLAEVAR